jgi:hypothetical protein
MRDNKVILWFEVEDTGCGMNLKICWEKPFQEEITNYNGFLIMYVI